MNNIPYFLSHLPIWKANAKDTVKITKRVREHQFDTVDKKTEEIVVKKMSYMWHQISCIVSATQC